MPDHANAEAWVLTFADQTLVMTKNTSTLIGTDPLLLTGIDPASAHVFVVIRPDQPIPDLP
jgi:hypothetical protein